MKTLFTEGLLIYSYSIYEYPEIKMPEINFKNHKNKAYFMRKP